MNIYVVNEGDSVDTIASEFGVDASEIIYINQLFYPYPLAIGQALLIPGNEDNQENKRKLIVNGYAYPYINERVLQATLPFLTELSVFSYGFDSNGNLIAPNVDPRWMIDEAVAGDVRPILTLTPFGSDGMFNNQLISDVVNDNVAGYALINNILEEVKRERYAGVDVDFEYIKAEDRDAFTTWVARLTGVMNDNGYTVSVALAPKTSDDQQGLLYQGKDYGGLGAAANRVLLMTYEWGYTYSEPMAVAPVDKVRKVLDYAVTKIPRSKISMGIPNYGYDWTLPYQKGVTKATTIGNVEAVRIAIDHGAIIRYDYTAQTPFFNYWDGSTEHEVWFEDVRSMKAKFDLINEYELSGAGYWQIMRLFLANWILLDSMFII